MEKKYLFNTFSVPFQYLSVDKMSLFIQERIMSFSFFSKCSYMSLGRTFFFLCSLVGLFFSLKHFIFLFFRHTMPS